MKFKLFSFFGAPLYISLGLPFGSFLISFLYTYEVSRSIYISLTYIFLIITHELGHAVAAVVLNLGLYEIEAYLEGGRCQYRISPKKRTDALILHSSGVLAQFIVLLLTLVYIFLNGYPVDGVWGDVFFMLIYVNLAIIIFSLIPTKYRNGLDSDGRMILKTLK